MVELTKIITKNAGSEKFGIMSKKMVIFTAAETFVI